MNRLTIGSSRVAAESPLHSQQPEQPEDGVAFRIPYGERSYDIALTDEELDTMAKVGLDKFLGGRALVGYEFRLELPSPDLPLLVDVRSINATRKNVYMETSVVTSSRVYEHRGILVTARDAENTWELTGYRTAAPLKNLPEH